MYNKCDPKINNVHYINKNSLYITSSNMIQPPHRILKNTEEADLDRYFTTLVYRILTAYIDNKFDSTTFVNLFIPYRALLTQYTNHYVSEIKYIYEINNLHSDCDCYWRGLFIEDKSTIPKGMYVNNEDLKNNATALLNLIKASELGKEQ